MDENEMNICNEKAADEPVGALIPETPLPDRSEATRYTDEYLAFLASLESSESNADNGENTQNSDNA